MKKLLTAILIIIYSGTSAGATLHLHYCMGKLADWGLEQSTSVACSQCGMEGDNQCCRDEYMVVKNSNDQLITTSGVHLIQQENVFLPVSFFESGQPDFHFITVQHLTWREPPAGKAIAVYLRNRVFRI